MDYKKIFELILDEKNNTVGGGSSSAVIGAMACGLMGMVATLSKCKDYGYSDSEYDDIILELNKLKSRLLEGSVKDNEAYMMIVNAYKMPKEDEESKKVRKDAIQAAGIAAAEVPLMNASLNRRVNDIGRDLIKKSNPACITDLKAGVSLSEIGIEIAKDNVNINLSLIKDEKIKESLFDRLKVV